MFLKPHTLDTQFFCSNQLEKYLKLRIIYKGEFMSEDFEKLEINQPKVTYLKP